MSKPPPIDEFPALSNEDVQLLYRIVTLAEESKEAPFRSLFAAYDEVLAEYGIEADHDRVYFRFLLRMGETKTEGQGLFNRFKGLLEKLGIHIDFGEDDGTSDADEPLQSIERIHAHATTTQAQIQHQSNSSAPSRRSSLNSVHEKYSNGANSNDQNGHAILPRSQSLDNFSSLQPDVVSRPPQSILQNGTALHAPHQRKVSFSKNPVERPISVQDTSSQDESDEDETGYSLELPRPLHMNGNPPDPPEGVQVEPPSSLSVQQMNEMAQKLRYHHFASYAIRLFRTWQDAADKAEWDRSKMVNAAMDLDSDTLKRQVYDKWRQRFAVALRQNVTAKFFAQQETKAGKARDLFLLIKAFTHWAQCTSDEISRTSAARRHILRTRYFNAWRDITVVNELKVRRNILSKFFVLWRRRSSQVAIFEDEAVSFYETKVTADCWRQWFWGFCEQRAPSWYERRARNRIFYAWLDKARAAICLKQLSTDFHELLAKRRGYATWIIRSEVIQHNVVEADLFRRRTLLAPSIETLRKEVQLSPAQDQVSRSVDSRIARIILRDWAAKTRMSLEAARLNDLRRIRNAWTDWNDELRCSTLSKQIDDRILIESLYKWVIAERFALFQRLKEERLERCTLHAWYMRANERRSSLNHAKTTFRAHNNDHLLGSAVKQWASKRQHFAQLQSQADVARSQHLTQKHLLSWTKRLQDTERLKTWAEDARFYVLTSNTIKNWRQKTVATRRNRRREAYSYLRDRVTTSTTRKLFTHWRASSERDTQLQSQAHQVHQKRLFKVGTSLFDLWREKTALCQSLVTDAAEFRREHVLGRSMQTLVREAQAFQVRDGKATEYLSEIHEDIAATAMRKLNWQLFQIKRQQETSDSLAERNKKRHYRSMLRYWAEKAASQRQMPSPTQRLRLPSPEPDNAREDEGTDNSVFRHSVRFDDVGSVQRRHAPSNVPATPAYLTTPSRRLGRGRSRLPPPTTPASTQVTPFLGRLRGQFTDNHARSARGDFARRLVGNGDVGTEDILETSPIRGD